MKFLTFASFVAIVGCAQSTVVFDPVQNKSPVVSTSPTQGTLTVNVNLTAQGVNHQGKSFSVLVFKNGVLVAAQPNNAGGTLGVDRTNASGQATLVLQGVDVNNCPSGTSANLANGNYDYYFAIQYAAETVTMVNTGNAGTSCGANGFIQFSSGGNLYTSRGLVTITGDSTLSIGNGNTALARQHTFEFTGNAWNFICYVTDINITSYTATTPLISIYSRNNVGTTTGISSNVHLLPQGAYRFFCYSDTNTNGIFFQSGIDRLATGIVTVNGANTTYLVADPTVGSFSLF